VQNGLSTTSSPVSSQAPPKANPVAHEAAVIVTGARPGQASGNRELFTETTTTVLVFENGAVISLSAAVIPGQLLFLTHQESKREVVAQVTHKRASRPSSCYVEVEFTEPFPKFWAIEFPKNVPLAAVTQAQKEAAEMVRSSEVTDDDPGELSFAPSMEEVVALKEEVEVLRKQLRMMKSQPPVAIIPAAIEPPAPPLSVTPQPAASRIAEPVLETPKPAEPSPFEAAVASSNSFEEAEAKVENEGRGEPSFNEEDLLPKVSLDFGQAPPPPTPGKISETTPHRKIAASSAPRSLRTPLLIAALLLVAVGGAYFEHWIPGLNKDRAGVAVAARPIGAAFVRPKPVAGTPANAAANPTSNQTADAVNQPNSSSASPDAPALQPVQESETAPESDSPALAENKSSRGTKSPIVTSVATRTAVRGSTDAPSAADPSAGEASGILPPKLVKSVRPNPPAAALQGFISGNVALEAVVDASGQVKGIKVVSGPETLRKSAIDALRQYKYEPATQNGKPVPAHVNVTVQFWYEP
jgi:periplasmic protein TonB